MNVWVGSKYREESYHFKTKINKEIQLNIDVWLEQKVVI